MGLRRQGQWWKQANDRHVLTYTPDYFEVLAVHARGAICVLPQGMPRETRQLSDVCQRQQRHRWAGWRPRADGGTTGSGAGIRSRALSTSTSLTRRRRGNVAQRHV
jgi:hypothetical protein